MICIYTGGGFFGLLFLQNNSQRLLLKFVVKYLCLESCLVSLEKFALLHCRFLILKLILKFWYCCTEKYFLLFTLHETFSNRCNVPFIYEFNLLSPYLVLCDKKHFFQSWLIWTTFHTARENFWPIKSSLC